MPALLVAKAVVPYVVNAGINAATGRSRGGWPLGRRVRGRVREHGPLLPARGGRGSNTSSRRPGASSPAANFNSSSNRSSSGVWAKNLSASDSASSAA
jgi:hypothetical protein